MWDPVLVHDHGAGELQLIPFVVMGLVFVLLEDLILWSVYPEESFIWGPVIRALRRRFRKPNRPARGDQRPPDAGR
jgi:hypothetical protein